MDYHYLCEKEYRGGAVCVNMHQFISQQCHPKEIRGC
jgi:hypothetical protein